MFKFIKTKRFFISSMAIVIACLLLCTNIINGQADPFSKIQEKLTGISHEKKKILQNLFTLVQEIEIIEREEKGLDQEIETVNKDINSIETSIEGEKAAFVKKQEGLKQVLKSYQRMGPGSYLEIILNSDSLTSLLQRVNILRDLSRDTGKLLEQLEISRGKLLEGRDKLTVKLTLLEDMQNQSREALAKKTQLKEDMEKYFASLTEEREYYQDQLANMQYVWNELKPLFSDTTKKFSEIIENGSLPSDALKITFSTFSIKGSLDEKVFNDIISNQASLEEMIFNFRPDKIEMELPQKNLMLSGIFIVEGNILKFQAEKGSFYGMPLESGSIEELFGENQLVLNLKPLLGSNTLQSVQIKEDSLELTIKPNLF